MSKVEVPNGKICCQLLRYLGKIYPRLVRCIRIPDITQRARDKRLLLLASTNNCCGVKRTSTFYMPSCSLAHTVDGGSSYSRSAYSLRRLVEWIALAGIVGTPYRFQAYSFHCFSYLSEFFSCFFKKIELVQTNHTALPNAFLPRRRRHLKVVEL